MKTSLTQQPALWELFLSDFIELQTFHRKGKGKGKGRRRPLATPKDKGWAFTRYLMWYNWQYRVFLPASTPAVDPWLDSDIVGWPIRDVQYLLDEEWHVEQEAFNFTRIHDMKYSDWHRWRDNPSSMIVPAILPAMGGSRRKTNTHDHYRRYFIRKPTVINFPGFVWMLGDAYTGIQIIDAWEQLPVIKHGKINRGDRRSPW